MNKVFEIELFKLSMKNIPRDEIKLMVNIC